MTESSAVPLQFQITGKTLVKLLKQLRPAYPRKKDAGSAFATFAIRPGHVTVGVAGATVGAEAETSGTFRVEVPFQELQWIEKSEYKADQKITFLFEPGKMTVGAVAIQHGGIHVVVDCDPAVEAVSAAAAGVEASPTEKAAVQPLEAMDAFVGFPLLGIYHTLRKYPPGTFTGNQRVQSGEHEIGQILKEAAKVLQPLGLTRDDIAALLDKRIGLEN